MNRAWEFIFTGLFIIQSASAVYKIQLERDKENAVDLFLREVNVELVPGQFGVNVTWNNLTESTTNNPIFLVEYRDLRTMTYSRLLTDNCYKYVFNLTPGTTYIFCLHLGTKSFRRLIDANCQIVTTLTSIGHSSIEKWVISAMISSAIGLLLGSLIGYFYKHFRMLKGQKEDSPDIPPRPFWTLNYRAPSYNMSASTGSYITVQDQTMLRNRKKSLFVKNDPTTQRILWQHKPTGIRRYSLPAIGGTMDSTNIYMDVIPDGNDYESIKLGSLASYASVMVPGIEGQTMFRRMTSLNQAGKDPSLNRNVKNLSVTTTRTDDVENQNVCERL